MKAVEVLNHFREVGYWVDWDKTCDQFLYGNINIEVRGIATAWIPTNSSLRYAEKRGLNLFITHEGAFYPKEGPFLYNGEVPFSIKTLIEEKMRLMDELGITLLRCHDTWDRMPEIGIVDAWATFLNFESEIRPTESYYKICLIGEHTVENLAKVILEKVRQLGQNAVLVFGDLHQKVSRMAVGTGAITNLVAMHKLGADVILATDDGINSQSSGFWAIDASIPLLVVNHATSEIPGMRAMANYLKMKFPGLPVEYVDVEFPYSVVQ